MAERTERQPNWDKLINQARSGDPLAQKFATDLGLSWRVEPQVEPAVEQPKEAENIDTMIQGLREIASQMSPEEVKQVLSEVDRGGAIETQAVPDETVEEVAQPESMEDRRARALAVANDIDLILRGRAWAQRENREDDRTAALQRLRDGGVNMNFVLNRDLDNNTQRDQIQERRRQLHALSLGIRNGNITEQQAVLIERVGLNIDQLGLNIVEEEAVPTVETQPRERVTKQRMIPVEDEDMPSYGERAPRSEVELRRQFRQVVRDYLRDAQDENALALDRIKTKIKYTFGGVEFDRLCKDAVGGNEELRLRVESEINAEIEARMNLRRAQLREQEYVTMTDKAKARERFINDNQEGGGGRKSALIALPTYKWLQSLGSGEVDQHGEKLTAQNVDRAFALMVMMGEKDPDFSPEWMKDFDVFRPYVVGKSGREYVVNMYWPSFFSEKRDKLPPEYIEKVKNIFPGMEFSDISADMMIDAFYTKLSEKFGDDSVTLARQLFDGYKERGNYDWQHYMAGLFTFASSRDAVAMNVTPPGYSGSKRPYVERFDTSKGLYSIADVKKLNYDGVMSDSDAKELIAEIKGQQNIRGNGVEIPLTYDKQVGRLAISPLRVKKVETPDQKVYDPRVLQEPRLLLRRARSGRLIQDTQWGERGALMKYLPQIDSLNTIKLGVKVSAAIDAIGVLGEASDKAAKVGEAVAALVTLREKGDSMVDYGVLTSEQVDRQIVIESANILWELGVNNEINIQDLEAQTIAKPNFLTPALINTLYARLGGSTPSGLRILGPDSSSYASLNEYANNLRRRTLFIMKRMAVLDTTGEANKVVTAQEKEMRKDLPTEYGVGVKTKTQRLVEQDSESINAAFDQLEKILPWLRRK